MYYEVFIPANGADGFDVTITVEAENWMTALKSGLERTGQGAEAIRNVMCDIKEDNTIHVTDASTRRVFVLKEMGEEAPPVTQEVPESDEYDDVANFATIKMAPIAPGAAAQSPAADLSPTQPDRRPAPARTTGPPPGVKPPDSTGKFERVPSGMTVAPPPGAAPPPAAAAPPPAATRQSGPNVAPNFAPPPRTAPPPAAARQTQPASVVRPGDPSAGPSLGTAAEAEVELATQSEVEMISEVEVVPSGPPPQPVALESEPEADPFADEPEGGLEERSWTSDDGRMRIGSASLTALKREEPEAKVVRERRAPSGQRPAVDIGRAGESVSQSALEEVFLEINRIHEGEMSMEQVINYVMDLSLSKIRAEAGSIMFADVNGLELYFATARGPKAQEVMEFRVPMNKGFVGFCAREGVSLAISDAEKDPRFFREISDKIGYHTRNICCAPIQFEGRVYGAIELMNKSQAFTNTEVNVLTYIGQQLAKFVNDLIMAREKI